MSTSNCCKRQNGWMRLPLKSPQHFRINLHSIHNGVKSASRFRINWIRYFPSNYLRCLLLYKAGPWYCRNQRHSNHHTLFHASGKLIGKIIFAFCRNAYQLKQFVFPAVQIFPQLPVVIVSTAVLHGQGAVTLRCIVLTILQFQTGTDFLYTLFNALKVCNFLSRTTCLHTSLSPSLPTFHKSIYSTLPIVPHFPRFSWFFP